MKPARRLPLIFWVIIFAAVAGAVMLAVGIALENREALSSFFKPSKSPSAPPQKVQNPLSQCRLLNVDFPADGQKLGFWDPGAFEMSLWTIDKKQQTLQKWEIQDSSGQIRFTRSKLLQSLVCEGAQREGCLYAGPSRLAVKDIQLLGDSGWAEINKNNDVLHIWTQMQNGHLRFYQQLGQCGQPLSAQARLFLTYHKDTTQILALSPQHKSLALYTSSTLRPFSESEIAQHPQSIVNFLPDGLAPLDCRESNGVLKPITGAVLGDNVAILTESGRLQRRQEIWTIALNENHFNLIKRFTPDAPRRDEMHWLSDGRLATVHYNFFRTKAQTLIAPPETSPLVNELPKGTLLTREEGIARKPEARLELYDSSPRGGKTAIAWPPFPAVPMPSGFEVPPNGKWLVSYRGRGRFLIFSQADDSERILAAVLECSTQK